ncbi:MAG: hypothetical protein ABJE10_05200 [bacterium]
MNAVRCVRGLRIVMLGALISACSSDKSVAPTPREPATLSQVLSEMALPSFAEMSVGLPNVPSQALATPIPSNCSYAAASSAFVCATVTVTGLTITQSYTLLDASGRPQSAFDPATTASVHLLNSVTGTFTSEGNNLTIDASQDLTLSGLLGDSHILNGTNTVKLNGTSTIASTVTPVSTNATLTIANLVVPKSTAGASAYPTSGTLTSDATTKIGSAVALTTHVQVTFNGTSKVPVTVTIGGFTTHCTVDLSNTTAAACA